MKGFTSAKLQYYNLSGREFHLQGCQADLEDARFEAGINRRIQSILSAKPIVSSKTAGYIVATEKRGRLGTLGE